MDDNFVPKNDGEFDKLIKQFIAAVAPDPAKYGVTQQDVAMIQAADATWSVDLPAHVKAQADAVTATGTKNKSRGDLETLFRSLAQKAHSTVGMDNPTRLKAGLPAREGTRSIIGAPETQPLCRLDTKGHRFVIHFVDENSPKRSGKPEGVQGAQVWSYVGDTPPRGPGDYHFLGLDTRTPYTDEHEASDAGKTAYYLLRWQNAKGDVGPWSKVLMEKIPG